MIDILQIFCEIALSLNPKGLINTDSIDGLGPNQCNVLVNVLYFKLSQFRQPGTGDVVVLRKVPVALGSWAYGIVMPYQGSNSTMN